MKKGVLQPLAILFILAISGCSKEYSLAGDPRISRDYNLRLDFRPVVDTVPLKIDSTYRNFWKESYKISAFKFYISKVELINTDSNTTYSINNDQYFLVDASDSTTWQVKLKAVPFRYNRISFLVGVDSIRNVSGAQTGALDPAKGMFWTWNSGYIMAKLEGTSPASKVANNKFEYHIGGFSGPTNVLRRPTLLFPFGDFSEILPTSTSVITIRANANAWFYNPHDLKIADKPAVNMPGLDAANISENYSKMFTVIDVTN